MTDARAGDASSPAAPRGRLTVRALLEWLTDDGVTEELLRWAPDVAALTTVLLERSHIFRFVVSPPPGCVWPPEDMPDFSATVRRTAADWCAALDDHGEPPALVQRLWEVVEKNLDTPVADLRNGEAWPLCSAALALHAIADEAAVGIGGAGDPRAEGAVHRARAQELLARTGSVARLPVDRVHHLPKTRTTPMGMTHRSLSRYSCTSIGSVPAAWHRAPVRRLGDEPGARQATLLLLPWPLRIRETDFVPVPGSVRRPEREPFGFFRYEPSEPLDLEVLDGVLAASHDEVQGVDVVVMPEGCLHESQVVAVEAVLARYGVSVFVAGLRLDPLEEGRMPRNGVHLGVHLGDRWHHYRQHKHHRWFLDATQVEQYNIAGALHPDIRWWEEMEIPPRQVNVLELGGGITVAAVVCEDLARQDGVADLLRSLGPSLVVTLLLDGPQLGSRWTSRYAGVLADDPGSAVLTITAAGMTNRSRPRGLPPSPVVAMWKDPTRGMRELPLDPGSHGVLVKVALGTSPRYAADGRAPADDVTDLSVTGVHAVRAVAGTRVPGQPPAEDRSEPLDPADLSVLCSWAEAVAQSLGPPLGDAADPDARRRLAAVLAQAQDASWRAWLGLPAPSEQLTAALETLEQLSWAVVNAAEKLTPSSILDAFDVMRGGTPLATMVHRVLRTSVDRVVGARVAGAAR